MFLRVRGGLRVIKNVILKAKLKLKKAFLRKYPKLLKLKIQKYKFLSQTK
jgi:hypothetical protein